MSAPQKLSSVRARKRPVGQSGEGDDFAVRHRLTRRAADDRIDVQERAGQHTGAVAGRRERGAAIAQEEVAADYAPVLAFVQPGANGKSTTDSPLLRDRIVAVDDPRARRHGAGDGGRANGQEGR